jgi:predicted amidohydrolase
MAVAIGFIEETSGARFHNAQALLRDGRILHVHRKANLATYGRLEEGKHYARGRRIGVTALEGPWIAATLICADLWNPALPWLAALRGASLLLAPVASAVGAVAEDFDNPAGWSVNLRHTSLTYGLPTIMANHCGMRGGLQFWGGSRILDAFGRELACAGGEPALVTAEIDFRDVRAARSRLPTIRDADPELVRGELKRLRRDELP